MKKYEGITLPIYGPWDLEKFRTRPSRCGGEGVVKYEFRGKVSERKNMKYVTKDSRPSPGNRNMFHVHR